MFLITHVPHHPCPHLHPCIIMAMFPSPMCPLAMCFITHVPHHPAPYAHVPIAHVSHCSCALLPMCPITLSPVDLEGLYASLPTCPSPLFTWVMGHIGDGAAIYQNDKWWKVVKKMSNVKKSNTWAVEEVHKKKINWHNEVHRYWCQFWHHIWWWPKTLKMHIGSIFDQFWWPSYLTSKLMSISVNLIM